MQRTILSLRSRAALASALTLLLFFSLASFGLIRAYEDSLNNAAESELRAYLLSLLGAIDVDSNGKLKVEDLSISVFDQPNSGVYAEIWQDQSVQWRSNSLIGQPLPTVESRIGEYLFFSEISGDLATVNDGVTDAADQQSLKNNLLSFGIDWKDGDVSEQFQIIVANDAKPFLARQQGFRKNLYFWLFGLGLGLVLLQVLLFKWLFRPIDGVIHEMNLIQSGEKQRFAGKYPKEVNVLVQSLNQFVEHETRQIDNIKNSLANLAHSLKTPLAVMRAEMSSADEFKASEKTVDQCSDKSHSDNEHIVVNRRAFEGQIDRISTVVSYQLNRAGSTVKPSYRKTVDCKQTIERLVKVLQKLHFDKGLKIESFLPEKLVFKGDIDDFSELAGNILENACKWAESHIIVQAENLENNKLQLRIIDNGPGIASEQVEHVLQRGKRLDTQTEGQGIGLSMVNDIVNSYSGSLQLLPSAEVDARFNSGLAVLIEI